MQLGKQSVTQSVSHIPNLRISDFGDIGHKYMIYIIYNRYIVYYTHIRYIRYIKYIVLNKYIRYILYIRYNRYIGYIRKAVSQSVSQSHTKPKDI